MAFDVDAFIAQAKAAREAALAKKTQAEAIANAKKADKKTAEGVTRAAQNRFNYAENLNTTLSDIEGQLRSYAIRISRGDTLDAVAQKDFDRLSKQYKSTSAAYTKAVDEGNAILAKMPETFAKEKKAVQKEAGVVTETPAAAEDISIGDFKNFLADPKNSQQLADYQRSLQKLGYSGPADGKYSLAFQAALEGLYQKRVQLPEALRGATFQEFIGIAASNPSLIGGGISGTGAGGTEPYTTISPATTAATYINAAVKSLLGREATPEEVKGLTALLNDAEAKNKVSVVNGVTKGGVGDRTQFIVDLITTGKYKNAAKVIGKESTLLKDFSEAIKLRKADVLGTIKQSLQTTIEDNGLAVDQAKLDGWAEEVKNGKDIKVVQNQIRMLAATGMPDNVKKMLADGNDLADVYAPYKTTMASILEIDPNSIKLTDPTLVSAIGPAGETPIYEFKNKLRQDSRWQYTNNAREAVSSGLTQVLRDFGFMG